MSRKVESPRAGGNDPQARIKELIEQIMGDDPPTNGPHPKPLDRYSSLPANTREWLEELREEDLDDFRRAFQVYRGAKAVLWFLKWFFISVIGGAVAAMAGGRTFAEALSWWSSFIRG